MDKASILNILDGNTKNLKLLKNNIELIVAFLELIDRLNSLVQLKPRSHEENRNLYSLYKAVGEGLATGLVEKYLIPFFGAPVKRAGQKPSFWLKRHPSIKLMGKILPEQIFFIRKLGKGEFYAAIWPWDRKPGNLTIHLGYYASTLTDEDFRKLDDVVRTSAHQKAVKAMETGIGGQIRGINLPTFLQMSEQEKTTCSLSITTKDNNGRLYLENGELVDGETGALSGKDAVFEMITWDNVIIEIEKYSMKRKNTINTPLLNILLEGLRHKDELAEKEHALPAEMPENPIPPSPDQTGPDPKSPSPLDATRPVLSDPGDDPDSELVVYDNLTQRPMLKYIFISITLLAAIGMGIWGIQKWYATRDIKAQYDAVMAAVEQAANLSDKESLINAFISANKGSYFAESAQKKLDEIVTLRDDTFFEQTVAKVRKLPLTHDFDVKAKAVYESYLRQFPLGKNAATVREMITELPGIVEESQYNHLIRTQWKTKNAKIEAYKKYIYYHPKGKHREEVELFLVLEIEERFEKIQKQMAQCNEAKDWTKCREMTDAFLTLFEKTYRTDEIKEISKDIAVKQALADLARQAEQLEPNHVAIRNLYAEFLSAHPDFSGKETLMTNISQRQERIDQISAWQTVTGYCANASHSYIEKIQQLDQFIDNDPKGPFAKEARALREKVRQERLDHDRRMRAETERKQNEAVLKAEFTQKQQQSNRLNQEIIKIQKTLYAHQEVYEYYNDGTFKDKRTGLTWCILDSDIVIGQCLTYDEALHYVESLKTGGRTNWRLPTFAELAGLYKNEPFFPATGPKWFWTSERVVKGYHEMVGIVTSDRETIFKRQYYPTKECGTVQAVHP